MSNSLLTRAGLSGVSSSVSLAEGEKEREAGFPRSPGTLTDPNQPHTQPVPAAGPPASAQGGAKMP